MKRIISLVLSFSILFGLLGGMDISVFGESEQESIDYSYLTPNQYMAMICTNNNYMGALNDYGVNTDYPPYSLVDKLLTPSASSRARHIFNEFNKAYDYKTTRALYDLLTFDLGSVSEQVMELEDYYTAIFLSILDTQLCGDNFVDYLNSETNKTILTLTSKTTDFLRVTAELEQDDIMNTLRVSDLDDETFQDFIELFGADVDCADLFEKVGDNVGIISDVLSVGQTINESVQNIARFSQLSKVSAAVEEVMYRVYLHCPEGNLPMRSAAYKVYRYVSNQMSYEIMALAQGGYAAFKYATSEILGSWWKGVLTNALGPYAAAVFIGQAVGKLISNYCFATDATNEQICAISALVNFEDVMVEAVKALRTTYLEDSSVVNSDNFMAGLHMLSATYSLGTEYVEDFVELVYEKGVINNIVYKNSEELQIWKSTLEYNKQADRTIYEMLCLKRYEPYYKVDAPSAYEKYFGTPPEIPQIIPATGMNVSQIKELQIGDEGAAYSFFKVSYTPATQNEVLFGETLVSSNSSVVEVVNENLYIGGYIKVVGGGTCTLTFTSCDGKHTAEITVTVEGTSSDGSLEAGRLVAWGEYPQSQVVDSTLLEQLNSVAETWNSYGYYSGEGSVVSLGNNQVNNSTNLNEFANITAGDFAQYTDVVYDGKKYRGVKFSQYRPSYTYETFGAENSYQDDNGYNINQVYWFQYDPILWRVIDEENNIAISEMILDAQAYNDVIFYVRNHGTFVSNKAYANSFWSCSLLSWLNNDFYNMAFVSKKQQVRLDEVGLTSSKVSLLYDELEDDELGTALSVGTGTDYAKAQGLRVYPVSETSDWRISNEGSGYYSSVYYYNSNGSLVAGGDQTQSNGGNITNTSMGIRPIIKIKDSFSYQVKKDGLKYTVIDNEYCTVRSYGSGETVTISSHIDDVPVTMIEEDGFKDQEKLQNITLPDTIETIGAKAFNNCQSLTSIKIPEGVTTINESTFEDCCMLEEVVLPQTITTIGKRAFNACRLLENISLPQTVTSIGESAFSGCYVLKGVELPTWLKTLESYAFSYTSIEEVVIPIGVKYIEKSTFSDCSALRKVTFHEGVIAIGDNAFENCDSLIDIALPSKLGYMGNGVFWFSESLTNIVIPKEITEISEDAFYDCVALSQITFQGDIIKIGRNAFNGCDSLTEITLPKSLQCIEAGALKGALKKIDYKGTVEQWAKIKAYGTIASCDLYAENQLVTELYINNTTSVAPYIFSGIKSITRVEIGNMVKTIGEKSFYSSGVKELILGSGITAIEECAFECCEQLNIVNYNGTDDQWATIDFKNLYANPISQTGRLYINNQLVTQVEITNVATISPYAFYNSVALESAKIGSGVTTIGENAFEGCINLYEVVLGEEVTSIGDEAFCECDRLSEIVLPQSLVTIGQSAFEECRALSEIVIPNSVVSVGEGTFKNCDSLKTVIMGTGITTIGSRMFSFCDDLLSVVIPKNICAISENAFYYCTSFWHILYTGTQEQWNAIQIDSSGNDYLVNASVHYETTENELSFETTKEATCNAWGQRLYQCAICSETKNASVSPAHRVTYEKTILPSCTEQGYDVFRCTLCNQESYCNYKDAKKHQEVVVDSFETCTLGTIQKKFCSVCSEYLYYTDYNDGTHTIVNDVCTVCGYNGGWKYYIDSSVDGIYIQQYLGNEKEVTIPSELEGVPVRVIGESAFEGNSNLTAVYMPKDIRVIKDKAFYNCSNLETVAFSNRITSIGQYAFSRCSRLTVVNIPCSVTTIGYDAFYNCTSLWHVLYEGTQEQWDAIKKGSGNDRLIDAVRHYSATRDQISCEITKEPQCDANGSRLYTCSVCSNSITKSIATLEHQLTFVETVAPTCTTQGYSLYHCSVCQGDYQYDRVASLGHDFNESETFATCTQGNVTRNICATCQTERYETDGQQGSHMMVAGVCTHCGIGEEWEYYFESGYNGIVITKYTGTATELSIPITIEGIKVVGVAECAFSECKNLTAVTLPDSVVFLRYAAFFGCTNLTTVTIGSGLTTIEEFVFEKCEKLNFFIVSTENQAFCSANGVLFNKDKTDLLRYPAGKMEQEYTIPNSVTTVENGAFSDCSYLKHLNLSSGMSTVGEKAFDNCYSLTTVYIPEGIVSVGSNAFSDCRNLVMVTLPESLVSIGDHAFYGCNALINVVMGSHVESLGNYAFSACYSLTAITIPQSLHTIGNYAFHNCNSLWHILYGGTQEQWDMMSITTNGNSYFLDTAPHYNTTGNEISVVITKEPTCATEGEGELHCAICSVTKVCEVPTTDHQRICVETVAPTCTEQGYDLYRCTQCNEEFQLNWTSALGHSLQDIETYTTCTLGTVTKGYCAACQTEQYEISGEQVGHTMVNGACAHCGIGEEWEYSFDSWNNGIRILKYLGDKQVVTIPDTIEGIPVVLISDEAFYHCSSIVAVALPIGIKEIQSYAFSGCSSLRHVLYKGTQEQFNSIQIQSNGNATFSNSTCHYNAMADVVELDIVSPTCVEFGYRNVICGVCGDVLCDEQFPKAAHAFDNGACTYCGVDEMVSIQSSHNYANNCDESWTIHKEGAKRIAITFSFQTYTESGWDFICLYNADNVQVGKYTGDALAGKRIVVCSDTVIIRLTSDSSNVYYGFSLDNLEAYYEDCTHQNTYVSSAYSETCESDGYTGDICCTECQQIIATGNAIPALGHDMVYNQTIDPTCVDRGYDEYCCTRCGNCSADNYVDELGHDYAFVETVSPTCTKDGYDKYYCARCETYSYSGSVSALGHSFEGDICTVCKEQYPVIHSEEGLFVTIKDEGEIVKIRFVPETSGMYYFFSDSSQDTYGYLYDATMNVITSDDDGGGDGNFLISYFLDAGETYYFGARYYSSYYTGEFYVGLTTNYTSNHNYVVDDTVAPTCLTDGYDTYHCTNCGMFGQQNYVDALGHDNVLVETVSPTCVDEGYDKYYCNRCGEYTCEYTGVIDHMFEDDVCIQCNNYIDVVTVQSAHAYHANTDQTWVISRPGAKSISVTFSSKTYVEHTYDYIYIYDGNDTMVGKYTGDALASQTITVEGDVFKIRLVSDDIIHKYGFSLTNISAEMHLIGDVNNDGCVDNKDFVLLERYLNGWDVEVNETLADVCDDDVLNNKDLALLLRKINGWDITQN